MNRLVRSLWIFVPFALLTGIAVAFVVTPLLARTAAIAAPSTLFVGSKAHDVLPWSLLAWDTAVVCGSAISLPVALCLLLLFHGMPSRRAVAATCVSLGVLLSFYVLAPLRHGEPLMSPLTLPWWQHGLELSLLAAVALAFGASQMVRIAIHSSRRS